MMWAAAAIGRLRWSAVFVPMPGKLGIKEFNELPQGLYGSDRASALALIDARYDRNGLIVADLGATTAAMASN